MGLVDTFAAEDRVEVKFSDFYNMMKAAVTAELALRGIKANIPHAHIEIMLIGENPKLDTLEAYEMTGLTPAQVEDLQRQYDEAVAELKKLQTEEE